MKKALSMIALALIATITPVLPLKTDVLSAPATQNSKITVSTVFDAQTNLLTITFGNLKNVRSISYTLTYTHDNIADGIVGQFAVSGQKTVVRTVFLGTCSAKSCLKHLNITNMSLAVTATYSNGRTQTTTYPISI